MNQLTQLSNEIFSTQLKPRFEGCNVGTWIGFKHVMYLAEEAIVEWFRQQQLAPADLLENKALSLEITDLSLRLIAGTRVDDLVTAELQPITKPGANAIRFKVNLYKTEQGETIKLATGKAAVQIARAFEFQEDAEAVPHAVEPFIINQIAKDSASRLTLNKDAGEEEIRQRLTEQHPNSFIWKWRIPYFYCHNTYRLQMSGYARIMEEIVDLFLHDRGISIGSLLYNKDYNWIPVVSAAKISLTEEARLEDTLYSVFSIDDVMQEKFYSAQLNSYVQRDNQLVQTATGTISHAYVAIADRRVGTELATFDDKVMKALTGQ